MSDIVKLIQKKKAKFDKGIFLFSDGRNTHLAKIENEQVNYLFTMPRTSIESFKGLFERNFAHKTLSGKNGNDSILSIGKPSKISNIKESFNIDRKEQFDDIVVFCKQLVAQNKAINKQKRRTKSAPKVS